MTRQTRSKSQDSDGHLQYLRIGTDYYKIIKQPLTSKDTIEKIVRWLKLTIREDHGDQVLREIPKFNSRQMDSGCLQRMQKLSVSF